MKRTYEVKNIEDAYKQAVADFELPLTSLKFEVVKETKGFLGIGAKLEVEAEVARTFSYLNEELNINNEKGRLRSLSFDCIYGTDANPRMARTAKMNMIMHGDGHGGVHHHTSR